MSMKFADTPRGWYQEKACGILASLSLIIDARERMYGRSGSLRWVYQHEMEHHFEQAVYDTLRLLQILSPDTDIASKANLDSICENGHLAFIDIMDGNMNGFDLEPEE